MFQRLSDGLRRKSRWSESRWHFSSRELNVGPSECKAAVHPLGRCVRSTKCKIYLVSEWSCFAKIGKSVTHFVKLDFPMTYMGNEFAYISRKICKSAWEYSPWKRGGNVTMKRGTRITTSGIRYCDRWIPLSSDRMTYTDRRLGWTLSIVTFRFSLTSERVINFQAFSSHNRLIMSAVLARV